MGKGSTIDEEEVALREAPRLDESLGDDHGGCHPIRWEPQGAEEGAFLALFPQGLRTRAGGVSGGAPEMPVRLYQLVASRVDSATKTSVPAFVASLNEGDAFVADCGAKVYVFHGASCSPGERARASQEAQKIVQLRPSAAVEVVTTADAPDAFWLALGGKGPVAPAPTTAPAHGDESPDALARAPKVCRLVNGQWVAVGPRGWEALQQGAGQPPDHTWLIDSGHAVVVRVGPDAPAFAADRGVPAIGAALRYLRERGREHRTAVVRLVLGHEPPDCAHLRAKFH